MILTVTMNPSIDISYPLKSFHLDTVNRVSQVTKTAGGKGLNVTRVLADYGDTVLATGLIGGTNGDFLVQHIPNGVLHSFYKISEDTRNCIAILHDNCQTEILEDGPKISPEEMTGFLAHFEQLLLKVDIVSISGSLPSGLPKDFYTKLLKLIAVSGKQSVLDCSGDALEEALKSDIKPTVIKPNDEELSKLLNQPVSRNINDLKSALEKDIFNGVEWVVVSLGSEGMFAKHGDTYFKVNIPKISVVNPVGSGDATVAGIVSSLYHKLDEKELLKRATVFGMLNAQESMTGHINIANYDDLYQKIEVKEV